MIDIVLADDDIKLALLVKPTTRPTTKFYEKILKELKRRHNTNLIVEQLRTKLKLCVTDVNQALKTVKTATGICSIFMRVR